MPLQPGNMLVTEVTFRDSTGSARDPSDITLQLLGPDGLEEYEYETDPEVVRVGQGLYRFQRVLVPGDVGSWSFEWAGTGDVIATAGGRFRVLPPTIPG